MSGDLTLAVGVAMLVATPYVLVRSESRGLSDAWAFVAGAILATGTLLLQTDVGAWSWILSPPAGGLLVAANAHALLAAGGPLRT